MTNNNELLIGSHVQVEAPEMLLGAVQETLSYGANCFMFYTGAPQNANRRPISTFKVKEALGLMLREGLDIKHAVVHAPYIINLANVKDAERFPVRFLATELKRTAEIGVPYLVLHPGSHVGKGEEVGLQEVVANLDLALSEDKTNVMVLIESMSGKGSELGRNIDQLAYILNNVKHKDRVGLCLDTCHLHDGGYDLHNFDAILDEIDKKIGLSKLKVFHINDSKSPQGSSKDRHENIGFGNIGFDTLIKIIYNPRLKNVIKILETPWVGDLPPYKEEITMIRNQEFNPKMKEELLARQGK